MDKKLPCAEALCFVPTAFRVNNKNLLAFYLSSQTGTNPSYIWAHTNGCYNLFIDPATPL